MVEIPQCSVLLRMKPLQIIDFKTKSISWFARVQPAQHQKLTANGFMNPAFYAQSPAPVTGRLKETCNMYI